MKKILISLFAILFVVSAVGCSKTENSNKKTVYFITDKGGIDDKSFNQGTWEGVEKAVKEFSDVEAKSLTSETDADYMPNLTTATAEKPVIVVAAGYLFESSMLEVAKNNPDQQYLLLDSVIQENGEQLKNVTSATFAEHEGSYLAGVAAAMHAKSKGKNIVGFLGGMEGELITKFEVGYIAGVKSIDPNMKVLVSYVGDFGDAAQGKIESDKMYNDGAYVIYHAAGGSGNGLIQAAQERHTQGEEVWVIGVDRDQYEDGMIDGHSVVLTSMIKRVDVAAETVVKDTLNGKISGGKVLTFTLANDGVGIPENNPNLSEDIIKAVEEAKASVISGDVVVPSTK